MILLHVTDIHASLADREGFFTRWAPLVKAVSALPAVWKPTAVAMTGDFVCDGSEEEFHLAGESVRQLLDAAGVPSNHVIVCPGNHDVTYKEGKADFTHFRTFCEEEGLADKRLHVDGTALAAVNACRKVTVSDYNHASLAEEDLVPMDESFVLLTHYPPAWTEEKDRMRCEAEKAFLILSGHTHVESPKVSRYEGAISWNGIAVSPGRDGDCCGCQLLDVRDHRLAGAALLRSLSQTDVDYRLEEVTWAW